MHDVGFVTRQVDTLMANVNGSGHFCVLVPSSKLMHLQPRTHRPTCPPGSVAPPVGPTRLSVCTGEHRPRMTLCSASTLSPCPKQAWEGFVAISPPARRS